MSRPLALGLIGCGKVARERHAPALSGLAGIEVVALADRDVAARTALASAFPQARLHADDAELLADPDIAAVGVLVPAEAHAEVVLAALAAGKHVFVEKPLALSLKDAHTIRRRVDETGVTLMVGFNLRHHALVREAAALVAAGALGQVVALQSTFATSIERASGALIELGAHHYDLWRLLLRDEVEVVSAFGDPDGSTVSLTARTRAGVAISFLVTQRSAAANECVVYGTRALLRLSPYRFDGLELQSVSEVAGDVRVRARRLAAALPRLRNARGGFVASYRRQWLAFADAVPNGRAEPGVDDGVRNVELLVAATESAAREVAVRLGEVGSFA